MGKAYFQDRPPSQISDLDSSVSTVDEKTAQSPTRRGSKRVSRKANSTATAKTHSPGADIQAAAAIQPVKKAAVKAAPGRKGKRFQIIAPIRQGFKAIKEWVSFCVSFLNSSKFPGSRSKISLSHLQR
jgi:hypothetical protein